MYLNTVTRSHGDIEILILRKAQFDLHRHLNGSFALTQIAAGLERPWLAPEPLNASVHQMRARSTEFEFDIFLGESDGPEWIYRRDRRVKRPLPDITIEAASGLPILVPEIVLLFKAKHLLAKDQTDFERVAPHLGVPAKRWLRYALDLAHPTCAWRHVINT